MKAAWGLGVGDLFCLCRCCRCAGLQPHEVLACRAVRPERAKTVDAQYDVNTTRRAWKATFELMRNGTKRVAMLGVPGIGKSRNLAIVFEARQSRKVFLFTKGQGGEWKAQSQSMRTWDAAACPHLQNSKNWQTTP